ncbi:MAG: excinuclease ABC subunit UvrC [Nanoarchaeota archaeon]|nr:excinuclease ABC subunit UvrC [Nanoarchaeota archaeon]
MFKPNLKNLPKNPGVYIFKNKLNEIIYIGKAKNLKNRISNYFTQKHENSTKTQFLVKNITKLDFIVLDNELEALLLENKLIKKHNPKYNISLKDSKTYPYIKISNDTIPKISSTRIIKNDGDYFGPYGDGQLRHELLNLTIKLFKLITPKSYSSKSHLNYEIGITPAKTLKEINEKEYNKNVIKAKEFLKGKNTRKLIRELELKMKEFSKNQEFEKALEKKKEIEAIKRIEEEKQRVDLIKSFDQDVIALIQDKDIANEKAIIIVFKISKGVINSKKEFSFDYDESLFEDFIKMYYSKNTAPKEIIINIEFYENEFEKEIIEKYLSKIKGEKVIITYPKKGEKLSLIKLAEKNVLANIASKNTLEIMKKNLVLDKLPIIIECFDMSNLGSEHLVGAMTRWNNEKEEKEGYRKFQIKSFKGKNDDFKAMEEVIYRRYKMTIENRDKSFGFPDLIIIDGGKGQLNAALKSLNKLNLKIPIISLAKKEEEIFIPNREESLKFDKNSKMMLYIRKIRDSAHNYVVSYNRKKRDMKLKKEFK